MMGVQVTTRGPLFDGRAVAAVDDFLEDAERALAEEGVRQVRQRLDQVLRNPTGFYESQVTTDRVQDDPVVTDSGIAYGPWLEGTSSRNQTTSFKGYHTFRQTAQVLQGDAAALAEQRLRPFLARMQ